MMQNFPLFLALQGRCALLVGGSEHAASKLDLEEPGRTMAEVAEEIFAKDRERFEARARALAQLSGEPA